MAVANWAVTYICMYVLGAKHDPNVLQSMDYTVQRCKVWIVQTVGKPNYIVVIIAQHHKHIHWNHYQGILHSNSSHAIEG